MLNLILSYVPSAISCFWFPLKIVFLQFLIHLLYLYFKDGIEGLTLYMIGMSIILFFFGWIIVLITYITSKLFCQYLLYRRLIFFMAIISIAYQIINNTLIIIFSNHSLL